MLVLCSNGLSSEKLISCVRNMIIGHKTAALVVTADNEYKEENYHVDRCIKELTALNLRVDLFDLDKQPAELLLNYDVVEFIGGNPFYLLRSIKENHATDILKDLANKRILIGWSAAAFVFSPTLELVNSFSPEMNFIGLTNLNALALTDIQVLPHYSRLNIKLNTTFKHVEEICSAYEARHNIKVIRINDGDGVIIDGNETIVCRT